METIEELTAPRLEWLSSEYDRAMPWPRGTSYFEDSLLAHERGEQVFLIARTDDRLRGYLKVVWAPEYRPFREKGIPEIEDLAVVPNSRRQGVARRLLDRAESLVGQRVGVVGIAVGIHPGYAAAQRMYVLRGYVPDAMPLTYHGDFVSEGQTVRLDDDLLMHLTKELNR